MADPFTTVGWDVIYEMHSLTVLPADGTVHNFRLSDEDAILLRDQLQWTLEGRVGPMPGEYQPGQGVGL
jgi:hypothetical protein